MRIAPLACLVLVCGALSAGAQVARFSIEGGQVVRTATPVCPLDMRVRQGGLGQMIATDKNGARVKMFAARLRLQLTDNRPDRTSQPMVNATVTIRGWTGKEQVLPIGATREDGGSFSRMTLTVPLSGGGLSEASSELLLPGFTAAKTVQLDSITYHDGQVWTFQGLSACQVAPDMFMPVHGKD